MRVWDHWELLFIFISLAVCSTGSSFAWPSVPKSDAYIAVLRPTENVQLPSFTSRRLSRRILQSNENRRLRSAAFRGDVEGVLKALTEGGEVNSADSIDNATALHWAAANGHFKVVEVLIREGADLDISGAIGPDFSGASALHLAAIFNQSEIVRLLVDSGADVDIDFFEFTEGEISGLTPLNAASFAGNVESSTELLEGGADMEKVDSRGFGPLQTATERGWVTVVETLIAAGVDVNANRAQLLGVEAVGFTFNISAVTALHLATIRSSGKPFVKIVKALIAAGANVDATLESTDPFVQGVTPLWLAADNRKRAIARNLIKAQASLNAPNAIGATPLLMASVRGHQKLLQLLVKAGADVNAATTGVIQFSGTDARHSVGVTPLYAAALQGDFSIHQALMASGGDPNKFTEFGQGPLHIVSATVGQSSQDIASDLLTSGADLDARNAIGWSPTMNAAYYGNIGVVEVLMNAGANLSAAGDEGETALDLVCSCLANAERMDYINCPTDGCEILETSQELVITLSQGTGGPSLEQASTSPTPRNPPAPSPPMVSTSDCLVFDAADERLECLLSLQGA